MKNSHVYFIRQRQIQDYDYNTIEGSPEFLFQNQFFHSFFLKAKCQ